jgi:hypothetical protein
MGAIEMDTAAVTMKQYTYDAIRLLRIYEYSARSLAGAEVTNDDLRLSGVACDTGSSAGVTCIIYGSGIAVNCAETSGTSAVTYRYIACAARGASVGDQPHRLFPSNFEYYWRFWVCGGIFHCADSGSMLRPPKWKRMSVLSRCRLR